MQITSGDSVASTFKEMHFALESLTNLAQTYLKELEDIQAAYSDKDLKSASDTDFWRDVNWLSNEIAETSSASFPRWCSDMAKLSKTLKTYSYNKVTESKPKLETPSQNESEE